MRVDRLSSSFIRWCTLDLFPSVFPVVTRYSKFLIHGALYTACLVLLFIIIFLLQLAVLRISSRLSVKLIILLKNQILVALVECFVCLFNVQDSQPCSNMGSV